MGYACSGKNGDIERLRPQADEAMYEAKHTRRAASTRAASTPATPG
jgi:PleD family two-component response regulator